MPTEDDFGFGIEDDDYSIPELPPIPDLPVFELIATQKELAQTVLQALADETRDRPLRLFADAPPGAGKTTLGKYTLGLICEDPAFTDVELIVTTATNAVKDSWEKAIAVAGSASRVEFATACGLGNRLLSSLNTRFNPNAFGQLAYSWLTDRDQNTGRSLISKFSNFTVVKRLLEKCAEEVTINVVQAASDAFNQTNKNDCLRDSILEPEAIALALSEFFLPLGSPVVAGLMQSQQFSLNDIKTGKQPEALDLMQQAICEIVSLRIEQYRSLAIGCSLDVGYADQLAIPIFLGLQRPETPFRVLFCDEFQNYAPSEVEVITRALGGKGISVAFGDLFQSTAQFKGASITWMERHISEQMDQIFRFEQSFRLDPTSAALADAIARSRVLIGYCNDENLTPSQDMKGRVETLGEPATVNNFILGVEHADTLTYRHLSRANQLNSSRVVESVLEDDRVPHPVSAIIHVPHNGISPHELVFIENYRPTYLFRRHSEILDFFAQVATNLKESQQFGNLNPFQLPHFALRNASVTFDKLSKMFEDITEHNRFLSHPAGSTIILKPEDGMGAMGQKSEWSYASFLFHLVWRQLQLLQAEADEESDIGVNNSFIQRVHALHEEISTKGFLLTTVHAAQGQEWDNVVYSMPSTSINFSAGLSTPYHFPTIQYPYRPENPLSLKTFQEDACGERNVAYIAATRHLKRLFIKMNLKQARFMRDNVGFLDFPGVDLDRDNFYDSHRTSCVYPMMIVQ